MGCLPVLEACLAERLYHRKEIVDLLDERTEIAVVGQHDGTTYRLIGSVSRSA
jgi:hypothetical protein